MTNIDFLKNELKDYARDIRLNLSTILTEEGAPGLTKAQILGTALACAYQTRHEALIRVLSEGASEILRPEELEGIRAAATIMAMNNVYYRGLHLLEDEDLSKMPARLRMSVIAKHGIDKTDFELFCLAVSALGGCSSCLKSHAHALRQAGVSGDGVQSALRIAAVINGVAQALAIG
jgi:lipoyl-dependent peroxiredoxin subunit D